jgi:DNA polymerase-1
MQSGTLDQVQLHLVNSLAELDACRRWVGERRDGPLFFDTESAGLNPYSDVCRMVQLGDKRQGWAFPAYGWGGAAVELLMSYQGELGAHNSGYDWQVLQQHFGVTPRWEATHDTMISGHIKDSVATNKLKVRAALDVDDRADRGQDALDAGMERQRWTWATVPVEWEPYWCYAALDPVLTAHLWSQQAPETLSRFRHCYDLERATARICAAQSKAGMRVDIPYVQDKITKIESYLAQTMPMLSEWNIRTVNSNEQVGAALNAAGVPTLITTESGLPSIGKETLKLYRNMFPDQAWLIDAIRWARKGSDLIGRYLSKFLTMAGPDGVVHYSIHPCRAKTTRMSITAPPMQTYDRDEPIVRGSFIPPDDDWVIITIDADQIEARQTAHHSGDPQMIADFWEASRTGAKYFEIAAGRIYRERITKSDPRYNYTKNATYGQIYGASLEKAALTAGVPVEQMRPVYMGFQEHYPRVAVMMDGLINAARQSRRGQTTSWLGRRLYCRRGHEYALMNYKIQCSAAEILKIGQVNLERAGLGPYLRIPMHDEFVMVAPRSEAPEILRTAETVLTDWQTFRVPITWSGTILEDRWRKV